LLDGSKETLRALHLNRNVFQIPYTGKNLKKDVLEPLIESLKTPLQERSYYRRLKHLFIIGATTWERTRDLAKAQQDSKDNRPASYMDTPLYKEYQLITKSLDKDEKDLLNLLPSVKEFGRAFFLWNGSANAVLYKLKTFAKEYTPPKAEKGEEEGNKEGGEKEEKEEINVSSEESPSEDKTKVAPTLELVNTIVTDYEDNLKKFLKVETVKFSVPDDESNIRIRVSVSPEDAAKLPPYLIIDDDDEKTEIPLEVVGDLCSPSEEKEETPGPLITTSVKTK
jgi:hypothetical protein